MPWLSRRLGSADPWGKKGTGDSVIRDSIRSAHHVLGMVTWGCRMSRTCSLSEALSSIRMNDKVERMAATIVSQQQEIEGWTEGVIRLETALEIAVSRGGTREKAI